VAHPPTGLTWGAILLAGLTALGSVYTQYTRNDREVVQRISALEAHRTDDTEKLDYIQSQVDKLVTWALGHK
jgi:hypothetical protein